MGNITSAMPEDEQHRLSSDYQKIVNVIAKKRHFVILEDFKKDSPVLVRSSWEAGDWRWSKLVRCDTMILLGSLLIMLLLGLFLRSLIIKLTEYCEKKKIGQGGIKQIAAQG